MADIAGSDSETELQSGGGDEQIFEGDGHSPFGLLAFDTAGERGCLDGDRMDRHVAYKLVNERLPALPPVFLLGALDAVRQFHNRHHGQTNLDFSVASFELFEDLSHSVALTLSGDDHIRIEY